MKPIKFPLYRIIWDDAESDHGWDEIPKTLTPKLVASVGYLILENDMHLMLAGSVGENSEDCNCRLQIPKAMVRSLERMDDGKPEVSTPVVKGTNKRGKNASRNRNIGGKRASKC